MRVVLKDKLIAFGPAGSEGAQLLRALVTFWQGLKFPDETERRRRQLHGLEAKRAGRDAPERDTLLYRGSPIRVGRQGQLPPRHTSL